MKDIHTENDKTLIKETEDTQVIVRRINIVKMCILLKAIHRFNEIPIKLPVVFFSQKQKTILKFVHNKQPNGYLYRPQIAKAILRRKNKSENTTFPEFKVYTKTIIKKTVW